jgi:anionic cell wall polymer biosynthesis LytR-Cps2A-Psr (LCP) family protein
MSNNNNSLDGFVPRRPGNKLGDLHNVKNPNGIVRPIDRTLHTAANAGKPVPRRRAAAAVPAASIGVARQGKEIGSSDLEDSLRSIDDESLQDGGKKSRRQRKLDKKNGKKPKSKARRIIKWSLIALLIIVLGVVGFFVAKGLNAGSHVLQGNIFDIVQNEPLKKDANGRSNFLLLGTSEDDPGHEGGNLTDSIMILSIDQEKKDAYTFSIPRDLLVSYGEACMSGYKGKINVYFSCSNKGTDDAAEQDRLAKTQAFIGDIVGMDIQYGVHVNYTVMRDVVNAIGGNITVNIESRDPNGQMDSNFDWKCGPNIAKRKTVCPPSGHFIDYPNGPAVLDAEHALYLAQARGDRAPTYGFEQSNFDRERNQQKILVAIRDKAMSAGTLTNLGAVTGLIDALGNNLRTNVAAKEIRTIMDLGKDIKSENIMSIDLFAMDDPMFASGPIEGFGSSVYPKAGVGNYTQLQEYLAKQLTSNPVVREGAEITVLNGSGVAGAGQTVADQLTAKEFIIDEVANAPEGKYAAIEIYQNGEGNTATAAKLKEIYNVTIKTTAPPVSVTGNTDFVIIVGTAPAAATTKTTN